jgi:hypothetical protein
VTLTKIPPGQQLTRIQQFGLNLVSNLSGGRDVVLAIDLTESVGLNNEGRIRLRQIIEDSIKPGDYIYIVPFANNVVLKDGNPNLNPLGTPIKYIHKNQENIEKILAAIPLVSDTNYYGTDIQLAELNIYQSIAQINHNRLQKNQTIKPQSIVWLTDAPLFTKPGITSDVWIETPADSPMRIANSPESKERQSWIDILPLNQRSLSIITQENRPYTLTVVDVTPTVQEFCTPAPGNQETCLVNFYLRRQLGIPSLILLLILTSLLAASFKLHRIRKKWQLYINVEGHEEQICRLNNNQRIAIGEPEDNCTDVIDCPGTEVRAYLERKGEKLYLVPNKLETIIYNGREITTRTLISKSKFRLNCPDHRQRDYEINLQVNK